jgi:hypothetical protein
MRFAGLRRRLFGIVTVAALGIPLATVNAAPATAASSRVLAAVTAKCVDPCFYYPATFEGAVVGSPFTGGTFRFTEVFHPTAYNHYGPIDGYYDGTWSLTKGADSLSGPFVSYYWSQSADRGNGTRRMNFTVSAGTGRFAGATGFGTTYLTHDPGVLDFGGVTDFVGKVDLKVSTP